MLDGRKLGVSDVTNVAGIPGPQLRAVLDGAQPDPSQLERLAGALGLHAADMFVIAWMPVPDELTAMDPGAGKLVPDLVRAALRLSPEGRVRVRDFARSLPQHERLQPPRVPPRKQFEPGFGAVLVRLLDNRNLDWMAAVRTLHALTAGHVYLSRATIGVIGRGEKEVTPGLLAGFAAVLGIPVGEVAAIGGIELPDSVPSPGPAAPDMAGLIWDVRRLRSGQLQQVIGKAASMSVSDS